MPLTLLLLACADPTEELARLNVQSADLDGIVLNSGAVIGGGMRGRATLNVTDTQGNSHAFPVRLRGATVGAVLQLDRTLDQGRNSALHLPDTPLQGNQLMGLYRGTGAAVTVGLGINSMNLENRHEVSLHKDSLSLGVSVFAGFKWLRLELGGWGGDEFTWDSGDTGETGETGDTADTGDTGDTSDTSDTGWPQDTGVIDSGASEPDAPPSTGGCASSESEAGCGGGGCQGQGCEGSLASVGVLMLFGWRRRRED